MKKGIFLSLSVCGALTLLSCANKQKNYETIETVTQTNDSMMVVSGIVAEQISPNTFSIVSMEGDTIWFTKDGTIVEGSGIIIGDSATVYYTMEGMSNNNAIAPKAKKVITKKTTNQNHKNMQKGSKMK